MKNNNSKKLNLYPQGQRWAVRVLLMVGMFGSGLGSVPVALGAKVPGPVTMSVGFLVLYVAPVVNLLQLEDIQPGCLVGPTDFSGICLPKPTVEDLRSSAAERSLLSRSRRAKNRKDDEQEQREGKQNEKQKRNQAGRKIDSARGRLQKVRDLTENKSDNNLRHMHEQAKAALRFLTSALITLDYDGLPNAPSLSFNDPKKLLNNAKRILEDAKDVLPASQSKAKAYIEQAIKAI